MRSILGEKRRRLLARCFSALSGSCHSSSGRCGLRSFASSRREAHQPLLSLLPTAVCLSCLPRPASRTPRGSSTLRSHGRVQRHLRQAPGIRRPGEHRGEPSGVPGAAGVHPRPGPVHLWCVRAPSADARPRPGAAPAVVHAVACALDSRSGRAAAAMACRACLQQAQQKRGRRPCMARACACASLGRSSCCASPRLTCAVSSLPLQAPSCSRRPCSRTPARAPPWSTS